MESMYIHKYLRWEWPYIYIPNHLYLKQGIRV